MKFIHFTDTHLITPGERLHGIDTFERLDLCLESILARHGDAAFCVLTGDVADRPSAGTYAAARTRLAAFPLPVHVLLGNHDDRDTFLRASPDTPVDEHGFVQSRIETNAGVFLLLDTVETGVQSSRRLGDDNIDG